MSCKHAPAAAARIAAMLAMPLLSASAAPAAPATEAAGQGRQTGGALRQIKVVADKAPDCSSLQAIVDSVTRGCRTNDDKAVAIYNFMQMTHYHLNYPGEPAGMPALKEINVYGWSLCGGLHATQSALWRQLGWEWRFVGWPGHTTVEAKYDGSWHYVDVFLRFYCWKKDPNAPGGRTIASQDDIKADPALVLENLVLDKGRNVYYQKDNCFEVINDKANWLAPAFLVCGDQPKGIADGVKSQSRAGSPTGWATITFDGNYSTDVNLAPGCSLTLTWDPVEGAHWWNGRQYVPKHSCGGGKDFRNSPDIGPVLEPYWNVNNGQRSFSNGHLIFAPDLASDAFLASLVEKQNVKYQAGTLVPAEAGKPASIALRLQSPYIMTKASGQAEGADKVEVSVDGGKTYKPVELKDFSDAVGGFYDALVRISFGQALKSLQLDALVQCNRCALPYLSPGANKITVSAADPSALKDAKLVVTYAYRTGSRGKSFEQLADAGMELARQHSAVWSETPTVVQKTFTARDLPATFDIDVPTPKDRHPVYPRMLFIRREVLPAGGKPMATFANAAGAKVGPEDQLKTLPNPFLVGTALPPAKPVRQTVTRQVALTFGHVVGMKGEVFPNHFLKTQKDNSDGWVLLVGGQLEGLPEPRQIAEARLLVPIVRGHNSAATKLGASLLKAPFEKGKPYDFKELGDVAGSANVPKQPEEKDYDPPKEFVIDLTRAVKQLAAGQTKFHGLALRTVPDRGVDEGYTVRVDLPNDAKIRLELDVYADAATKPAGK